MHWDPQTTRIILINVLLIWCINMIVAIQRNLPFVTAITVIAHAFITWLWLDSPILLKGSIPLMCLCILLINLWFLERKDDIVIFYLLIQIFFRFILLIGIRFDIIAFWFIVNISRDPFIDILLLLTISTTACLFTIFILLSLSVI